MEVINAFPQFMRNRKNLIDRDSQYTDDIEGYVYDGADGSQMATWSCRSERSSKEHVHDFEEYFIVAQGQYTLLMGGKEQVLKRGDEVLIPKGMPHAGRCLAGTRTIHAFGGTRARRATT